MVRGGPQAVDTDYLLATPVLALPDKVPPGDYEIWLGYMIGRTPHTDPPRWRSSLNSASNNVRLTLTTFPFGRLFGQHRLRAGGKIFRPYELALRPGFEL